MTRWKDGIDGVYLRINELHSRESEKPTGEVEMSP
jgi:hypothetical protein